MDVTTSGDVTVNDDVAASDDSHNDNNSYDESKDGAVSSLDEQMPVLEMARRKSIFFQPDDVKEQQTIRRRRFTLQATQFVMDNDYIKRHVYRKTLQALIYPMSSRRPHNFILWTATSPAYCFQCEVLLWGLARQGLRCTECGAKCHERCKDLFNDDCLQRAAQRSSKKGSEHRKEDVVYALSQIIEQRVTERPDIFSFIRNVFNVDEADHILTIDNVRETIKNNTSSWSAKITITVLCALGLEAKDDTGLSDPYVTIQVGKTKKRTKTIPQNLNPVWENETFTFDCNSWSERIKVRVWDEDNDIKARIRSHFTKEPDDFLGQAIIDVRTLSSETELWYNLEERTERSNVSGSIRLHITVEIEGEEKRVSYHTQYTCLHESILDYFCKVNDLAVCLPTTEPANAWRIFFDEPGQEVVKEFCLRYGVESIYQIMTHFACLTSKYSSPGVAATLSTLLAHINSYYSHVVVSRSSSAADRFALANFGKEKFITVIDALDKDLQDDLSLYRHRFPAADRGRLLDLKSSIDLLTSIMFFRKKVLEIGSPPRASLTVRDCVTKCIQSTYSLLHNNCHSLFLREFKPEANPSTNNNSSPSKKNAIFWQELITLLVSVIEEDRQTYSNYMNHFPQEVVLDRISVETMWHLYSSDLKCFITEARKQTDVISSEFVNLHLKLNWFYSNYIQNVNVDKESTKYSLWLEPLVSNWIIEKGQLIMDYTKKAYERDRLDGFQKASSGVLFSNSITDIFTQLTEWLLVIQRLKAPFSIGNYVIIYAEAMKKALMTYAQMLDEDFARFITKLTMSCVMMNNIQNVRVLLAERYEVICQILNDTHNTEVREHAAIQMEITSNLNALQQRLDTTLDRMSNTFITSMDSALKSSLVQLKSLLLNTKSLAKSTAVQQSLFSSLDEHSAVVSRPLLDFLEIRLSEFANLLEKSVLKRILKHLWNLVVVSIEKTLVLPSDKKGGLHDFSLLPVQCQILDASLEHIIQFFYGSNNGLKRIFMEKSVVYQNLKNALSLYTQTTDILIKTFVQTQTSQVSLPNSDSTENDSIGEVSIEVNLVRHPGTDEKKITVKVVAANSLKWSSSSVFKPFIEVTLVGPYLNFSKARAETKTKTNEWSPKFNEIFHFSVGNEDLAHYELHLSVKDYCFGRDDHTVGIAVLQLEGLEEQHSCCVWLQLGRRIQANAIGSVILQILAQRSHDEQAKYFLKLKSDCRYGERGLTVL